MEFKLVFVDGHSLVLNEKGEVLGFHEPDGTLACEIEDLPYVHGIWFEQEGCTIPWDEVVDYNHTDFHLTSDMYLDNGQVVDEGRIVRIEIDEVVKWNTEEDDVEELIEDVAEALRTEYEGIGVVGEQMTAFANVALRLCEQMADPYDLGVAMKRLHKALLELEGE